MVLRWIFLTSLPLLAFANEWIDTKVNETHPLDIRNPRVTGRIVKLYSGTRPESVYCSNEGFQADPTDCSVFYRCVKAHNGKYNVFRFNCGPGTVYDPDTEICNHPQSTKRTECGGAIQPVQIKQRNPQINENEIERHQSELPSPISTRKPDQSFLTTKGQVGSQPTRKTAYPWSTAVTQQTTPPSRSGSKSYPLCTADGFMGDPDNCRTFYRCVGNTHGGFLQYEFQCSETTIWDDDAQSCNHPWAVQRSRCGRSKGSDDKTFYPATKTTKKDQTSTTSSGSQTTVNPTTTSESSTDKQTTTTNGPPDQQPSSSNSNNPTIQQQLQVNYGSKITQTQTQISNGPVIQNQTQINYGDKISSSQDVKQNQTQISKGSAISQTQTQINYGEKAVQTQAQIDHTQQASQAQTSESESSTTKPSTPDDEDNESDSGYNNQPSNPQPHTDSSNSNNNGNMGKECKKSGFMGDPNDCKKFYRCVDNGKGGYTKYEFTCGEGTVWDSSIEGCNHEWAVPKCGGSGSGQSSNQESSQTTTQAPQSTTTQKSTEKPTAAPTTTDDSDDEDNGYGNQNPELSQTTSSTTMKHQEQTTTTMKNQEQTTATESSHSSGSSGNECTSSGFIGDDNDCKKFYRCVDNGKGSFTRYEFKCGEGTVWDPEIEACNHAWAVSKCGGSSTDVQKVDETTTSKPATTAHAASPTTTQQPAEDSEIDDDNGYGQVNNEQSSSSTTSTTTTTTTKKPQSASSGKAVCKESGFMGDNENCKKFYRCVDNGQGGLTRYEFTCGEGTAWDQSIESCNHEELVEKCGGSGGISPDTDTQSETTAENAQVPTTEKVTKTTPAPSQTTTSSQTSQQQEPTMKPAASKECSQEGFMGDPNNCKKFYRCVDNGKGSFTKYEFECGEGTVWDSEIDSCNHPTSANCGTSTNQEGHTNEGYLPPNIESDEMVTEEGISTTTTTTTTSRSPTSENVSESEKPRPESKGQCSSEGFYANSNDCRKFYRCVDNGKGGYTKYDFSCGEGTVWVQDLQTCDHDSEPSTCKQSSSVTQSPSSEQEQQSTTESSSSTQSSTTGSSSSSQTQKPDKEDETPSEKPSSSGSSEECSSEGFYGDKKDCRKFYRCVDNGKGGYTKYDFDCGEGTAWDSEIESCNHIDQVKTCKEPQQSGKPEQEQGENKPPEQEQGDNKPNQEQTQPDEEQDQSKPALQDEQPSQTSESTTSSTSDNGSQQSPSSSKATCEEEGYFGDPDDCKKFYRCVDNGNGGLTKYDFDCGEGTIWDQDITTCNHPQDVKNPSCKQSQGGSESSDGSSSTSSSSTTSSTSSTTSTTSSSSQSQTTSSTTESSSSGSSNCSQDNSSKKPDNNGYDCPEAGYYADPNDCKKFYRCVDWEGDGSKMSIYHFECGEGTIWDPALDTCNHEESVYPPRDCSGSQSQTEKPTESSAGEQTTTQESTTQEQTEGTTSQQQTTQEQTEATTQEQTEATTKEQTEATTQEQTEATTKEQTEATTEKQTETTTNQQQTTQEQTNPTTQEQTEATTSQQQTTQEQTEATTQEQTEATTSQQQTTQEQTEATTSQQQTTQEQTEATTQEQTEATTQEQPEQTTAQQTTEQTTTQESTTEQSSTDESTTQESTTQQQSTTSQGSESTEQTTTESDTTNSSATTESNSPGNKECPGTEEDQYLYVCPTSFRRHPKYCNMFYQCSENDDTHELKIATFKCPNNTIYDESQTQCVDKDKADKKCDGEMAEKRRFKRLGVYSKEPIVVTSERLKCPSTGHYPFEKQECSPAFLKCQKSKSGTVRGQVYRCPEGYVYWAVSRRCESKPKMRDCKHTINDWSGRWEIPIERRNVAPQK